MAANLPFNQEKFMAVLHHVVHNCGQNDNVGKTVLYKMLYFSDFDYYEEFEEHLTGEEYVKLPHGPAPSHFRDAVKVLKRRKAISEIDGVYGGKKQYKLFSLKDPDLSKLSAQELQVINNVIERLNSMNATQVSAYSHQDIPWEAANDKEPIDYEMVFYRDDLTSVRSSP